MRAPDAAGFRLLRATSLHARRGSELAMLAISASVARPLATLAGLLVVHWLALLAFALTVRHNGWLYYQGGDQIWLLTTGWLIGLGELAPSYVGYAWSLVVAPITMITGPNFVDAMPAIIALNVLVLAPLALWAVYAFAARLGGRAFGLLAAAGWVAAPYAVIPLWRADYHERYVEQVLPQALGLTGLADYPSMVLLLVGALLFVRALDTAAPLDAAAAGLVVAFAIGMKPSNGLLVAAPAGAALLARNLRPLVPFALAFAPAFVTLALWKERGLGTIPAFALEETRLAAAVVAGIPALDRYLDLDWGNLHDNASQLREYFWSARLIEWLPIAGLVGVARRSPPIAGLLGVWFTAFVVVKGTTPLSTVSSGSFFRFMMPAFPAYFLLAASTLLLVPTFARAVARRWPDAPPRPLHRAVVAALALALALVPLVVVPLLRPLSGPGRAVVLNTILTPVDERIRVSIDDGETANVLRWSHPEVGSSNVFYLVFRTDAGSAGLECTDGDGAAECSLEVELLGTTREPEWRDEMAPDHARYRVGIAANWIDDANEGDIAAISAPVQADD